jgi:hypothetical protein
MTKKPVDRERLKERWLSTQELSGGPYRLGAINRHRQFSLLHAAAKARVIGISKSLIWRWVVGASEHHEG